MIKSDLNLATLISAYSQGYFPMPHPHTGVVQWFRPDPRAILPLNKFHISRSFKRFLSKISYQIKVNNDFLNVIKKCSQRPDTWINKDFIRSYHDLYKHKLAHSIEIWCEDVLLGGLYGVSLGGAFFAESMFSSKSNGSKIALMELVHLMKRKGMILLECQFSTPHLKSLGVYEISDQEYMKILAKAMKLKIVW